MFLRSPSGTSSASAASAIGSTCFSTGTDSPVRAASSIFMDALSSTRQSAGTESPASSSTTSPVTSSADGRCSSLPSRMTLDWAALICCRASRACSLLASWTTPSTELMMTTARMMMTSAHSGSPWMVPVMAEMAAATSSMMTIGSAICSKKRFQSGVFSSFSSSLGPYWLRRLDASAASSSSTSCLDARYSFKFFPPGPFAPGRLTPDHNSPGGARARQGCHAGPLTEQSKSYPICPLKPPYAGNISVRHTDPPGPRGATARIAHGVREGSREGVLLAFFINLPKKARGYR